jgi:hypothetical protein
MPDVRIKLAANKMLRSVLEMQETEGEFIS